MYGSQRRSPARRGRHLLPDGLQRADQHARASPTTSTSRGCCAGIYHLSWAPDGLADDAPRVQLLASGVGLPWIQRAQQLLADDWGVAADLWSVTSWNELSREAVEAEEWNLMHPLEDAAHAVRHAASCGTPPARSSRSATTCVPYPSRSRGGCRSDYHALGADGFGFADTRPAARRFFKIDAESVVVPGAVGPGRGRPRSAATPCRRRSTTTGSTTRRRSPASSRRAATPEPGPPRSPMLRAAGSGRPGSGRAGGKGSA